MKVHTEAEIIRLFIPYIGRDCFVIGHQVAKEILSLDMLISKNIGLPYLKPLSASLFGDMANALDTAFQEIKHLPDDEKRVLLMYALALDILRWKGYDCDRLIDQGLALCISRYSIADIL